MAWWYTSRCSVLYCPLIHLGLIWLPIRDFPPYDFTAGRCVVWKHIFEILCPCSLHIFFVEGRLGRFEKMWYILLIRYQIVFIFLQEEKNMRVYRTLNLKTQRNVYGINDYWQDVARPQSGCKFKMFLISSKNLLFCDDNEF